MGTTFVSISNESSPTQAGFWMSDTMLELWLRLLALHLPEPTSDGTNQETIAIRNQWLLASKGYFTGCVPHGMEEACSTLAGRAIVRTTIQSLLVVLRSTPDPLSAATLNLLGIEGGTFMRDLEASALEDIGRAFLDLLDGKVTGDASSTAVMPGSTPYHRD